MKIISNVNAPRSDVRSIVWLDFWRWTVKHTIALGVIPDAVAKIFGAVTAGKLAKD